MTSNHKCYVLVRPGERDSCLLSETSPSVKLSDASRPSRLCVCDIDARILEGLMKRKFASMSSIDQKRGGR